GVGQLGRGGGGRAGGQQAALDQPRQQPLGAERLPAAALLRLLARDQAAAGQGVDEALVLRAGRATLRSRGVGHGVVSKVLKGRKPSRRAAEAQRKEERTRGNTRRGQPF